MEKFECYTIGTSRAAKLLGVSAPTVRGMIDHPQDVGFELGFRKPSRVKNPSKHTYRVWAKVIAEKLGISIEEVLGR